jgi:predicted RNase H-like HicB family nuclease
MKYAVIYEQGPNNYSAYVPDLPGCVAAADTFEEIEQLIKEAIIFHLKELARAGDPIPPAVTRTGIVEVQSQPG